MKDPSIATIPAPTKPWSAERYFYSGMALAMMAAVMFGFARTYFLKPWFPEVAHLAPSEPFFFYVHGVFCTAWIVLLVLQPLLVGYRRLDLHRSAGWFGAGLAAAVVATGIAGALIAARRPGGFLGITVPPQQFLAVPMMDLALFAVFTSLAVVKRRDPQAHKRFMLLATIGLLDAAIIRWPFADMTAGIVGSMLTRTDLFVDLFLLPLVIWDSVSRGRVHTVTLLGGMAVIASQPLRVVLSETNAWLGFAGWLVGK